MAPLNYHHLHYFWVVAREGSVAAATKTLRLAQPTISGQIRALEEALDTKLFTRAGRGLVLTDEGRVVYRYADEIFSLGRELSLAVKGRPTARPARLVVGIADVMPKLVVRRLLEPALRLPDAIHLVCREDKADRLLAELGLHMLDVVLADAPVPLGASIKAYSHLLGECAVGIFAERKLAARLARGFPRSLDGAPLLLPTENSALRRGLDAWLSQEGIRPKLVAEFEDSALLKVFGQDGLGAFPAPAAIAETISAQHHVTLVGEIGAVRERFYAISAERRLKEPHVVAIMEAARHDLFG